MNKKITIIELLNKIANNEEVPKKIKYGCHILMYYEEEKNYIYSDSEEYYDNRLLVGIYDVYEFLNYKVEIIEEDNEIKGFGTIVFDKDNSIMEDYIYSIVTKEAFESMEYKIGDKNE